MTTNAISFRLNLIETIMAEELLDGDHGQTRELLALSRHRAWTPKRLQLVQWFRTNAASLADAYEGALQMLGEQTFPGRIHFIAHAVRDIADRLAFVLDPQLSGNRVQYEQGMDLIAELWPGLHATSSALMGPSLDDLTISYKLASVIHRLVEAHRARRKRPSNYTCFFVFLCATNQLGQTLISD